MFEFARRPTRDRNRHAWHAFIYIYLVDLRALSLKLKHLISTTVSIHSLLASLVYYIQVIFW